MSSNRTLAAKDTAIRAAKYRGRGVNTEYRVAGIPGLVLVVQRPRQDGLSTKTWRAYYTATSESSRRTTRKLALGRYPAVPLREAMARALEIRTAIDRGVDPVAAERAELARAEADGQTFADLVEHYLADRKAAEEAIQSLDEVERILRRDALPRLGSMHPATITDVDIEGCVDEVAERGSLAMARRLLTHLRTVYNYAIKRSPTMRRRYGLSTNPADLVGRGPSRGQAGKYGREGRRDRSLSDDDIHAFFEALNTCAGDPSTVAILKVLLLTGQRLTEVRCMTAEELRLRSTQPEWELPSTRTKNRLPHLVPLTEPVRDILKAHVGKRKSGPVFVSNSTSDGFVALQTPGQLLNRLQRQGRLKVPRFTPHDLRRTVETGLAALEVPKEIRDRVMNHKDSSIGGVSYNKHDYRRQKREALERWSSHVAALLPP